MTKFKLKYLDRIVINCAGGAFLGLGVGDYFHIYLIPPTVIGTILAGYITYFNIKTEIKKHDRNSNSS